VQQQAIDFLKTGKELFDNAVSLEKQKEGYENFLKGIELLVRLKQYTKDNKKTSQAIGQKITELLIDCKYMKDQIMTKDPKVKQIHESKIQNSLSRPLPLFPSPNPTKSRPNQQNQNQNQNQNPQDADAAKIQDQVTSAILVKRPTITWDSIAGLEIAKATLKEAIYLPLTQPQIFQGVLTPWKGILLYGPPGTGKTMLAEACASMVNANFFNITSSDITSKYVGETEKIVKT
jgi:vacuolar protein-sorting-associated protein 4